MSPVAFQKKHVKKVFVCVEQQVAVPTKRLGATAKPIKVNANVQSMLKPVPREKNVKTECVVSDALLIYLLFFISVEKNLICLKKGYVLSISFIVTFTAQSYVGRWERAQDKCKSDCTISSNENIRCIVKCNGVSKWSSNYTVLASTVVWDGDSTGAIFGTFDGVNKIEWYNNITKIGTWTKQGGIY